MKKYLWIGVGAIIIGLVMGAYGNTPTLIPATYHTAIVNEGTTIKEQTIQAGWGSWWLFPYTTTNETLFRVNATSDFYIQVQEQVNHIIDTIVVEHTTNANNMFNGFWIICFELQNYTTYVFTIEISEDNYNVDFKFESLRPVSKLVMTTPEQITTPNLIWGYIGSIIVGVGIGISVIALNSVKNNEEEEEVLEE